MLLTQLDTFRGWALGKGLDALNGELQGKIEIGSVTGNLITGLTVHDVKLRADSTELMYAPSMDLTYQLAPIFQEQSVDAAIVVHNPIVKLIRNQWDSSWNFAHITKPSTDSIKTPFNWTINVSAFEMKEATFMLHDLTADRRVNTVNHTVDYSYLELDSLNLALQAHIAPTSQSIWLQNVACTMPSQTSG